MQRTPRPWSILSDPEGEGQAIVVPALTSVTSALTELIDAIVGERYMTDNPAIVREAADHRIARWRSCTAHYLEANGVDAEEYGDGGYWAEDGDGKRNINVLYVDRSLDAIAEEAAAEEVK